MPLRSLFVYKELKFSDLPEVILKAAVSTSIIMIVIVAANVFEWVLTIAQIPVKTGHYVCHLCGKPHRFPYVCQHKDVVNILSVVLPPPQFGSDLFAVFSITGILIENVPGVSFLILGFS